MCSGISAGATLIPSSSRRCSPPKLIKALDRERLTMRAAHARTGVAAADFSRIRDADLGRFTADRLITILNRLGARVEVKGVRPTKSAA
jgi:predicted XRE-type DNA-binding protein